MIKEAAGRRCEQFDKELPIETPAWFGWLATALRPA